MLGIPDCRSILVLDTCIARGNLETSSLLCRYTDPKVTSGYALPNEASDMFSFGVIMSEMLTGEPTPQRARQAVESKVRAMLSVPQTDACKFRAFSNAVASSHSQTRVQYNFLPAERTTSVSV